MPLDSSIDTSNSNDTEVETYFDIYKKEWRDLFYSTGMDIVFSGHAHVPEIIKPVNKKFNFPTIIGGSDHDEKSYVAVKAEVSSSELKVFYENYDGASKRCIPSRKHNRRFFGGFFEKFDGSVQEVYNIKR